MKRIIELLLVNEKGQIKLHSIALCIRIKEDQNVFEWQLGDVRKWIVNYNVYRG